MVPRARGQQRTALTGAEARLRKHGSADKEKGGKAEAGYTRAKDTHENIDEGTGTHCEASVTTQMAQASCTRQQQMNCTAQHNRCETWDTATALSRRGRHRTGRMQTHTAKADDKHSTPQPLRRMRYSTSAEQRVARACTGAASCIFWGTK